MKIFRPRRADYLNIKRKLASKLVLMTLLTATISSVSAQKKYISPVDFPILLAGNVGEIRTNAFHAGIDIKGMKGLGSPVFAVANGHVWRIGVSPWGYGNVVYVKHTDGAISVYAHLHEFAPKIAQWVRAQQYAKKSFRVDLYPSPEQFVVKQGERIATVGNSGSSGGAHVHFEIRDPRNGLPMNLIKQGIYTVADHEKPVVKSIKLYEIEQSNGIEIHRLKESVVPGGAVELKLRDKGYLAYEVVDYKDGKSNTMGVYSIEQKANDQQNYGFKIDHVDFASGKYVNTFLKYDAHKATRFDVIRAYVAPNNPLKIYSGVRDRGIITASETPLKVTTTITDDAGNQTFTEVTIVKDSTPFVAPPLPSNSKAVKYSHGLVAALTPNMFARIGANSLLEDAIIEYGEQDGVYTLGTTDIPVLIPFSLAIKVPDGINTSKAGIVQVFDNDKITWRGGNFDATTSFITASLTVFGKFKVSQDTTPPTITAVSLAARGSNLLRFRISDDLSGIATYTLTVDGAWELAEYDPKFNSLIHKVRLNKTPVNHDVILVVTDAKGNTNTFKQTVKW